MYLLYQAFTSPEIEFLRPALRGKWITHPTDSIHQGFKHLQKDSMMGFCPGDLLRLLPQFF